MKQASRLGQRMRAARAARGINQSQLAARCGLFPSQISELETGAKLLSVALATKIAKALHVPVRELLELGHPEFQQWCKALEVE